jgi:hypothetical protein
VISLTLILPLMVAVACGAAGTLVHGKLPPAFTARLLAVMLAVLLLAAVPTLWALASLYVWHLPQIHHTVGWCSAVVSSHHAMPPLIGLLALVAAIVGTVRTVRHVRRFRRVCRHEPAAPLVASDVEVYAVTVPGRGGHVVLSSGLLELLDPSERAVVLAHEQTHARFRHDRYLLLANVADRLLPLLRPVSARLRLSLERWADEGAVDSVGDRQLVARTLRKVAVHGAGLQFALSFQNVGVVKRITALRSPRRSAPSYRIVAALTSVAATGLVAAGVQLHHVGELVRSLCSM